MTIQHTWLHLDAMQSHLWETSARNSLDWKLLSGFVAHVGRNGISKKTWIQQQFRSPFSSCSTWAHSSISNPNQNSQRTAPTSELLLFAKGGVQDRSSKPLSSYDLIQELTPITREWWVGKTRKAQELSCIPARAGLFPARGPAQLLWLSTALGKHKPCAGPAQPEHSASTASNLATWYVHLPREMDRSKFWGLLSLSLSRSVTFISITIR